MITIPVITDPLGRGWRQPALSEIKIQDNTAIMNSVAFKKLHQYDCSIPTGVYDGKMWKRRVLLSYTIANPDEPDKKKLRKKVALYGYQLVWYGPSDELSKCSINTLLIKIAPK